jgi:tetrahydromethanopterin S-methyltransferase subunit G
METDSEPNDGPEDGSSIDSEVDVARLFGNDYKESPKKLPEVEVQVNDTEWEQWAQTIEFKVSKQGQLVIGIAAGLVVTLGFTVLMGRVVLKLVEGQKVIITHLNGVSGDDSTDGSPSGGSRVSYTKPSNRVDRSQAVVDEALKEDLESRLASSTTVEIPDELRP